MSFPSNIELAEIREKLKNRKGFKMLPADASELDKARFQICQELLKYAHTHEMSPIKMAKELGIPESEVVLIFNHDIEKFSTDQLFKLYSIIYPDYKITLS